MKTKQTQWWLPREYADTVIHMSRFHIALNYLPPLGKKYEGSGLEDLLIESYDSNTSTCILKGKSYNHGERAHKFSNWKHDEKLIADKIGASQRKQSKNMKVSKMHSTLCYSQMIWSSSCWFLKSSYKSSNKWP